MPSISPIQFIKPLDANQAIDQYSLGQKQALIDALKQSALNPQQPQNYGAIASRSSPITPIVQAISAMLAKSKQDSLNDSVRGMYQNQYSQLQGMMGGQPQQSTQDMMGSLKAANAQGVTPDQAQPIQAPQVTPQSPQQQQPQNQPSALGRLVQALSGNKPPPVQAPPVQTAQQGGTSQMNPFGIAPGMAANAYVQDPSAYMGKVLDYYAKRSEPMNLREGSTVFDQRTGKPIYVAPKDGIQIQDSPNGPIASSMSGYNEAQASRIASNEAAKVSQTPNWASNASGQPTAVYATPPAARGMPTAAAPANLQTTGGKASQEALGKASSDFAVGLNDKAAAAVEGKRTLSEMSNLLEGFNPGKFAPVLTSLGAAASALGVSPETVQGLTNINPGDAEAFQKGTAALATESAKQVSSRVTQMEFKTFLANNPNWMMTSNGVKRVMDYMGKGFDTQIDQQKEYADWSKTHSPERAVLDFPAYYNQKRLQAIDTGKTNSTPAAFTSTKTKTDVTNSPVAPVKITSKAEYEKLPKGTVFVGPDGLQYTRH